jgi:light-regulated signal transduction histidine kinase (bacteriophytochrome)
VQEDFGQFVYAASHDLAEPLAVVSGYTRLLAKRYGKELDADGAQFVEAILGAVSHAEEMIENLRAFSRVDSRGESFEPVDCEKAAHEAAGLLAPAIEKSHAQVDIGPLPTLPGDEAQLVRLFAALLSNSLKFRSEEHPSIAIAAERDGACWRFAVSDNGVGVAEEESERIFHMFQRGDTAARSGSGAGLAIARRIVERHRGTIWVASPPEGGSVFHFTLLAQQEDS